LETTGFRFFAEAGGFDAPETPGDAKLKEGSVFFLKQNNRI
jgi:hypothetical protein